VSQLAGRLTNAASSAAIGLSAGASEGAGEDDLMLSTLPSLLSAA
jgi:hypothetical protein